MDNKTSKISKEKAAISETKGNEKRRGQINEKYYITMNKKDIENTEAYDNWDYNNKITVTTNTSGMRKIVYGLNTKIEISQ